MTIAASFGDLLNTTYISRIQDALGNSGASLTMQDGRPETIVIRGNPNGLGLQIRTKQQAVSASEAVTPDTIALSPAAQEKLSDLLVASKLLAGNTKPAADSVSVALEDQPRNPATPTPPNEPAGVQSGGQTTDPTNIAALAQENPTQVIKDVVSAAQAALTDTAGFYAATANDPQFLRQITFGMSEQDKVSFLAAYANRELTLQNAADVPGWQYDAQTTLTSQGEAGGATSPAGTGVWGFAGRSPAGVSFTSMDFGIAQLYISWPSLPS